MKNEQIINVDDTESTPFFNALCSAINDRFPTNGFVVSCFKTIAEISKKTLCVGKTQVIVRDRFTVMTPIKGDDCKWGIDSENDDYFVIQSSNGKDVLYADVIDQLIKMGFNTRQGVSYKFLEDICPINEPLMKTSTPCYGIRWGS